MKKTLLFIMIVVVLLGYMTYARLSSQGWTLFSPTVYTAEIRTPEVSVASTPILFVGDIMLGRYVETLTKKSGDELYAFKEMKEYLKQHITIANLEGPIPNIHTPTPINGFSFSFPASAPRALREGGVSAVSLANNHMFDKGRSGYEQTKSALDVEGVMHFGGYTPTEGDYFETKLGATTIIIYGITMIATGWDEAQALDVTKKLRREHPGAHLVTFIHWGDEYKTQNIYQRAFAHALIDDGVDTIIGSHPHIIQGIETYQGKPIFYSLGNFIFDQYWRSDLEDGLAVKLSTEGAFYVYELVPIRSTRSVPSIATSTQRERILKAVSVQSPLELQRAILEGKILVR
jgi:poly-gamma-glutamate synthesis protein (capsule biosynthesis protein)